MINEKNINSRIIHKHDIEANWNKATSFIPKQGELIVYDIDSENNKPRIKIGDGENTIIDLPFITPTIFEWAQASTKPTYTASEVGALPNTTVIPSKTSDLVNDNDFISSTDILDANGTLKNSVLPEGYPYKDVGEILPETVIPIDQTFQGAAVGTTNYEFELYIGNSYIVNYNGTEYNCEAKSLVVDNVEVVVLGNAGVMDSSGKTELTNEPFLIVNAPAALVSVLGWYGGIMPLDGAEEVTLSIHGNITKKISKEFLPNIPNIGNIVDGSKLGSVRTILTSDVIGYGAHAEGYGSTASGAYSHAEGHSSNNAFDFITEESTNEEIIAAWNDNIFTLASGWGSHAEGYNTLALGDFSHAEGQNTKASGNESHAEGSGSIASGADSHAEGWNTTASGLYSHAEGKSTTASGRGSHAEGDGTTASGNYSHAEGSGSIASGAHSHAEGIDSTASGDYQHVQGKYNVEDTTSKYAHIVGNGSYSNRSNAHTLDWDGNAWYAGDVYVGGTNGANKDEGSQKLATETYVNEAISNYQYSAENPPVVVQSEAPTDTSVIWVDIDDNTVDGVGTQNFAFDPTVYGLPVLYLTGDTTEMTKENAVPLNYIYGERSGECTLKWQGSSSLSYPKKNYTIKFDDAFEAADGWGEQKKYCLKANFIDHSHARNVVSAKLWGEIVKSRSPGNGWLNNLVNGGAVDGFPVVLTLNGEFHGLYTFNIPKDGWMFGMGNGEVITETEDLTFDTYVTDIPSDGTFTPTDGIQNVHIRKRNTVSGGRCYVDWDTNKLIGYGICAFLYNENNEYIGTFYPDSADSAVAGDYGVDAWKNMNGAYVYPTAPFSVAIPDGHTVLWAILLNYASTTSPDGSLTKDWSAEAEANNTWIQTWLKTGIEISVDHTLYKQAILCADATSEATCFQTAATLSGDFELEYVLNEDDTTWVLGSLNRLINACMNSNGTDLDTTIARYLDWSSAIDYYIFACLIGGADMAGKNYLLTTFDGTKWIFSAYDMDSTYGLWWNGKEFLPSNHYPTVGWYASYHKVMQLIRNYKLEAFKARYTELRNTVLSEDNVALAFENFVKDISTSVLNEDVKKWTTIPSSSVNNVSQIRDWYRRRTAFIDKEVESL